MAAIAPATRTANQIRPSDYGAALRIPADLLFTQRSLGSIGGIGEVTDVTFPDCIGGGPSANFSLKSDDKCRFHVMSAGYYWFGSAQPSSVFTSDLASDAFLGAGPTWPLGGVWAVPTGVSGFLLSAGHAWPSAAGNGRSIETNSTAGWATSAVIVQGFVSGKNNVSVTRVGLAAFITSGVGTVSAYTGRIQYTTGDKSVTVERWLGTANTELGIHIVPGFGAGTMRLSLSAVGSTTVISSFFDGVFLAADTDSDASRLLVGYSGLYGQAGAASVDAWVDDWQALQTNDPPFVPGDLAVQASASFYELFGAADAKKWGQIFHGETQLGFQQPVVFTGLTSAFVSAGTSAYFNTATYGVVRLASAAGTTGLSGVVGFSATGPVVPSAVGNDLVWVENNCYGISAAGGTVSGMSGVVQLSAAANILISAMNGVIFISGKG